MLTFTTPSENGLKLENCKYISADNNINNLNHPKVTLETTIRISQEKHEHCLFNI